MKQKESLARNPQRNSNQLQNIGSPPAQESIILPKNPAYQNDSKESFSEVISDQKPPTSEPPIAVTKLQQIIYRLLASAQDFKDLTTKDSNINPIMSIISEIPTQNE